MKKIKLKNLAEIKSGFPFRSKIENDESGNVRVIQLRDVDECGKIDYINVDKITFEKINKKSFLRKGDVLFKAKSNNKTAAYVEQDVDGLLATSHFFILKVRNSLILSEYLAWFLNQKIAQRQFEMLASGSSIPIINKNHLQELKVIVPDKELQEKIVTIHNLRLNEKKLVLEIEDRKEKLIEKKLLDLIRK